MDLFWGLLIPCGMGRAGPGQGTQGPRIPTCPSEGQRGAREVLRGPVAQQRPKEYQQQV